MSRGGRIPGPLISARARPPGKRQEQGEKSADPGELIRCVAAGTPYRRRPSPIRVTPTPPVPMADRRWRPRPSPSAREQLWAITIVTEKVETIVPPRSAAEAKTSRDTAGTGR